MDGPRSRLQRESIPAQGPELSTGRGSSKGSLCAGSLPLPGPLSDLSFSCSTFFFPREGNAALRGSVLKRVVAASRGQHVGSAAGPDLARVTEQQHPAVPPHCPCFAVGCVSEAKESRGWVLSIPGPPGTRRRLMPVLPVPCLLCPTPPRPASSALRLRISHPPYLCVFLFIAVAATSPLLRCGKPQSLRAWRDGVSVQG